MESKLVVRQIDSLDHQELAPYRTLRMPVEHMKQGIFVAEGEKVVRRLLESNLTIVSMLMTQEWFDTIFPAHHSTINHSPTVFVAGRELLEEIVGYNLHQGIMAVAKIPSQRSLEELTGGLPIPHLLVALDGLVNSENVGVIVRNCAAFGVDAIIVGETSSSPYLRRAVRNSMGAVFRLPVVHPTRLVEALEFLKRQHGTKIIAAHPHEPSAIMTSDMSGNACIVFGNEGEGISENVLKVCTDRIAIPMLNEIDSLNVSSASAVFLYEASSQRSKSS